MNLQQFLLALRARFGVFILALVATVLAAAVASLLLPKTYRATVSLLVDAKNEQSLSNVLPLILPQEKLSYLQTQMDIITSKRVARKGVQELKLAESPSTRADFDKAGGEGAIEESAVRRRSPTNLPRAISTRCSSCEWNRRGRRRSGMTNN